MPLTRPSEMSFLRLPPEVLQQIFDQIGSSFFRGDLRRLTLCKQWFEFALPVCLKCVTLSQDSLRGLVNSGLIKKQSSLKDSLETLDLELGGYRACISTLDHAQASNNVKVTTPDEAAALRDSLVDTWITVLDNDLGQLAILTQESRKLRTLCIRAWSSPSLETPDNPEDYLSLPTMRALLSVDHLSVLVLDLSISFLNSSGGQGDDGCHICPVIGALLVRLRTLHLRLRNVCPNALKPQDPSGSLRLSAVVVNLSLAMNIPGRTSAAHSKRCGSQGVGFLQLKEDMREQAEALASQMVSPKTVRVLTHSLPQFETQSLDVLTGKTMILTDDMAWDEDGKIVEEHSASESDLSDGEFAAFLDD
ncbi:hypothetical protein QQS21_009104 [Conoideocrella luteorostrata]|uniref:F-box domain-containing protein n=1 Tax=Conoideocrella luteorostrata TaxID=1105319 RepID=A0AAJ0FY30_9HYPO|nr:hypothetical protein QQS21_009104 [Conoideocrella luteorostrata]